MVNIKEIRQDGKAYSISDEQARQNIGDLSKLQTTDKRSLVNAVNEIKSSSSGNVGGTTDYSELTNKPKVNGVELVGDKSLDELGITIPSDNGDSGGSCSCIITPYTSPNLWDGTYKQGKLNYNTGAIDETQSSYYAEIELEPNTDYVVYCNSPYVLYPEGMTYSKSNNHAVSDVPVAFNSGSFKYIRFWVALPPADNAHLAKQHYLIKGTSPAKVGRKKEAYFLPTDIQDRSFYRSVPYKLRDLADPFKPTAVAMAGDSITQGVHSANHADIVNCYAKLFGDYILGQFNEKIHNIPMFDERVERYGSSTYYSGESGIVLKNAAYVQMDFYGAYVAVNTYNGQKPSTSVDVYIDGQLHTTFNFADNDTTTFVIDDLSMEHHTIKINPAGGSGSIVMGSFGIKKYVTFANRGVSGIASVKIRDYHAVSHLFDNDDIVFCMIGTNDRGGTNPALYDFNVRQVFKHGLEAMGKQVILMSGPPAPREYWDVNDEKSNAGFPYKMRDIVAWVNAIAGKDNDQVISFYNWLIDLALEQNRALDEFFNDGLHPTEECYRLMYEHLLRECGWGIETVTV